MLCERTKLPPPCTKKQATAQQAEAVVDALMKVGVLRVWMP